MKTARFPLLLSGLARGGWRSGCALRDGLYASAASEHVSFLQVYLQACLQTCNYAEESDLDLLRTCSHSLLMNEGAMHDPVAAELAVRELRDGSNDLE